MCECACLLFVIIEKKIVFDLQHFVKSGYSFARLVSARNQELTPILLIRLPATATGRGRPTQRLQLEQHYSSRCPTLSSASHAAQLALQCVAASEVAHVPYLLASPRGQCLSRLIEGIR